jgi:hypothetical protein
MKTRPERDLQPVAYCVYSISCECSRSYTVETSRPRALRIWEHRHNLKQGFLEQ